MLLSEIFDQLTFGELSQLYVSGRDEIGIQAADYEKIIPHINLGLSALHQRFDIKRNSLLLQQDPSIDIYYLHSKHALSNDGITPDVKYIIDSVDNPFTMDILKIEEIRDSSNNILTINDRNNFIDVNNSGELLYNYSEDNPIIRTIFNYSNLSLKSTYSNTSALLTIEYRAKHTNIPTYSIDLATYEVDLPYPFLEPLLYFIAARMFSSMSEQDGTVYMQKYELACKQLVDYGLNNTNIITNHKLDDRGFL